MPQLTPRRIAAAVLLAIAVALTGVVADSLLADLPAADELLVTAAKDSTRIYDRDGVLLYEVLDPRAGRRTRVGLDDVSPSFLAAIVAVEDARFYSHHGLDGRGITRAALQALRHRRIVSGGSTITQQLARLVLMTDEERAERSVRRKLREMVLALRLERAHSKDLILEMYVNEVYFGEMAYGIEAAANEYFDTTAASLTVSESAMLAGLVQAPAIHNPRVDADAARRRQQVVLDLMVRAGSLTSEEASMAKAETLQVSGAGASMLAPHFVSYVLAQLEDELGSDAVHTGALQVTTSLDFGLQMLAEDSVSRHISRLSEQHPDRPDANVTTGALIAVDPASGEIAAMVGSADYYDDEIAGAVNVTLARRQPGSAIKPITYATALDTDRWGTKPHGEDPAVCVEGRCRPELPFTAATVLADVPTTFPTAEGTPYRPVNYDRQFHGPLSLRSALATSSNIVAVRVLEAVGVDSMIDTALALGVDSLSAAHDLGLGLTLGSGEVSPLELTFAYAALANQGVPVEPVSILSVVDADGSSVGSWPADDTSSEQAISPAVAFLISDILSDDRARMPAFGEGSALAVSFPAAVKTGTTTDYRDNWTVGYTPQLATGVWVGNADNRPMTHVSGVTGAGPIWHDFMEDAHSGVPVADFTPPPGLVRMEVCAADGLLPSPNCAKRTNEWFILGTQPVSYDRSTLTVEIDAATGLIWRDGCEGPRVSKTFAVAPPDAGWWMQMQGIPQPPTLACAGKAVSSTANDAAGAGAAEIAITHPPQGAVYAVSGDMPLRLQTIPVRAHSRGNLSPVEIFVDHVLLAEVAGPSWESQLALSVGKHTLVAVGQTSDGQEVTSEPVTITVLEPTTDLALAAASHRYR
jgi:membrane peptidoglycan carboxypeptidase